MSCYLFCKTIQYNFILNHSRSLEEKEDGGDIITAGRSQDVLKLPATRR